MIAIRSDATDASNTCDNPNYLSKPPVSILSLSPQTIGKLDYLDVGALFSLWTVFSKCGESLENGRRLENLSWRLCNRELLYADDKQDLLDLDKSRAPSHTHNVPEINEVPNLSSSVDSVKSQSRSVAKSDSFSSVASGSTDSESDLSRKRHPHVKLSSEKLQQLFQLFKPGGESEESYWRNLRDSKRKEKLEKNKGKSAEPLYPPRSQSASTSTPIIPTSSNLSTATSTPSSNNLETIKASQDKTPKSFEKSSLQTPHAQSTPSISNSISNPTTSIPATTSSNSNSLFSKRPTGTSLFSRPDNAIETTKEVFSDFSDNSTDEYTSEDDPDEGQLSYRHRTETSTSIVRGFDPSNISVSVKRNFSLLKSGPGGSNDAASVSPETGSNLARETSRSPAGPDLLPLTKARPSKVPREKMFFIESSPSESESYSMSTSGESGFGARMALSERKPPVIKQSPKPSPKLNPVGYPKSSESLAAVARRSLSNLSLRTSTTSTSRPSLFSNQSRSTAKIRHNSTSSTIITYNAPNDNEEAIDSDDADDDDIDDDSAWDSVDDESDSSSFDERALFSTRDEVPKPLTRPSLLSSMFLNKPERLQEQQQQHLEKMNKQSGLASRNPSIMSAPAVPAATSATAAAAAAAPSLTSLITPVRPNPASTAISAAIVSHNPHVAPLMSPRTTRRNMLATELSESLRKNLLWERQQLSSLATLNTGNPASTAAHASRTGLSRAPGNSSNLSSESTSPTNYTSGNANTNLSAANAALKRRHTSVDVSKLNKHAPMDLDSWTRDMEDSNVDFNYHARGW